MTGEEDGALGSEGFDEQRENPRFEVSGATLQYERPKLFTGTEAFVEKECPVVDMSRGGVRFLADTLLSAGMQGNLRISNPDDADVAVLRGQVRWGFRDRGAYRYRIGAQFAPFGSEAGCNTPAALMILERWESRSRAPV